jgi:hypothetical protein
MRGPALLAVCAAAAAIAGWLALRAAPPADSSLARDIDGLRRMRRERAIPARGAGDSAYADLLERVRACSDPAPLEAVARSRDDDPLLRVDLMDALARRPDERVRVLLGDLVAEAREPDVLRLAALEPLMKHRDAATFEVLRRAWSGPFPSRPALCRAFGENGRAEAVPILVEALADARAADVRAAAAAALGAFRDEPAVREALARRSGDPVPAVRQAAAQSLEGRRP